MNGITSSKIVLAAALWALAAPVGASAAGCDCTAASLETFNFKLP